MTRLAEVVIPYERQADPMSNRMCGAAALCMVYRSFDLPCSQAEVWPHIAQRGALGELSAQTHLLAADALRRGLSALIVKARDPVAVLKRGLDSSLRLVLNHRLHFESRAGHYSVLVDLADDYVILHDPQLGPAHRVLQYDLLKLWQPGLMGSEIAGNVVIAFANTAKDSSSCGKCGTVIPESILCPGCQKLFPLRPAAVLGCVLSGCTARTWELIFCPHCDTGLRETSGDAVGMVAGGGLTNEDGEGAAIRELSASLDQFCNALLASQPEHPDPRLRNYVETIRTKQKELHEAQAQEAAQRQADQAAARRELEAANAQKKTAQAAPTQPKGGDLIDGAALGLELIRELGLQPAYAAAPKPLELPSEFKPVKKEPPPKEEKKSPAQLQDYELFRKAVQKPAKPASEQDFGTFKGDQA
jgi:hypothetical protein